VVHVMITSGQQGGSSPPKLGVQRSKALVVFQAAHPY